MSAGLRDIGGKQVWVEEVGDGPVVVCIHGLGGTGNVYGPQIPRLAEGHTVVTFDLTGHGMSPLTDETSIGNWAEDTLALLDDLGADSAALVSHSMGTLVAQQTIAMAPERICCSVFLGPVRNLPDAARGAQSDRAKLVRAEGMAAVATGISQNAVSAATRAVRPDACAFIKELLQRQSPEGYAAACEALGASAPPEVGAFSGAVLAITGTEDMVSPPAQIEAFAAAFEGAASTQAVVIDDIGHWTSLEAHAEVTDRLVDFLACS